MKRATDADKRYIWRAMQLREKLTDKAIARRLGITAGMLKGYQNIMRKNGGPARKPYVSQVRGCRVESRV